MGFANVYVKPPLAMWFWEDTCQPRIYWCRWGMPGWKWLG
jgi:hypothetical protein